MLKSIWRWIKKLTLFIWLLFMVIVGIWLAKDNGLMVTLELFSFELPQTSLGMVVCLSLLVGALMGFFTNYLVLKPGLIANKRALKKATKEVASLRMGHQKE